MASIPPNQLITCPYNMAHQVEHSKMQFHLAKCRKNYPDSKKTICPFDATHIVNELELQFHVTICPMRGMFDCQRYIVGDVPEYQSSAPAPPPAVAVASDENWDEENFTSYKPDPAQKSHIIKKIKGAQPAERHAARMEGVRNYQPPPQPPAPAV